MGDPLTDAGITDRGLYHLRKNPALKRVQVFRTPGVTTAGLILLRVALPHCEISGDIENVILRPTEVVPTAVEKR